MGIVVDGKKLAIGRGRLYVSLYDPTTQYEGGERFCGLMDEIAIRTTDDVKKAYDTSQAQAPLCNATSIRREAELSFKGKTIDKENLALALMGSNATLSQTGASITGEHLNGGHGVTLDRAFPTTKRKISAVVVKVGASTKTVNVDYKTSAEDLRIGRIYIMDTGSIVAGDDVTVDYTYATIALPTVQGGMLPKIEARIRFTEANATGDNWELEVWRAMFMPDGDLSSIADDYKVWASKALVIDDPTNHPGESQYRLVLPA